MKYHSTNSLHKSYIASYEKARIKVTNSIVYFVVGLLSLLAAKVGDVRLKISVKGLPRFAFNIAVLLQFYSLHFYFTYCDVSKI